MKSLHRLVTHYDYHGLPFRMPQYCCPSVTPRQTTTCRQHVTCQHCLRKLRLMPQEHGVHVPLLTQGETP